MRSTRPGTGRRAYTLRSDDRMLLAFADRFYPDGQTAPRCRRRRPWAVDVGGTHGRAQRSDDQPSTTTRDHASKADTKHPPPAAAQRHPVLGRRSFGARARNSWWPELYLLRPASKGKPRTPDSALSGRYARPSRSTRPSRTSALTEIERATPMEPMLLRCMAAPATPRVLTGEAQKGPGRRFRKLAGGTVHGLRVLGAVR